MLVEKDFVDMIGSMAEEAGGQRQLALALVVSPQYLNHVLQGRQSPGPKLLKALGYERVVCYFKPEEEK